jgi:endoglucanase Acf2
MRLSCYLVRRVILCAFFFPVLFIRAQTAVSVGAGSYATSIPPIDQYLGGYYSMTAQQVVNDFTNLHIVSALTNRPIPSNKWWTDILVADRSYQPSGGGPRILQQDPYGGQLWAYPYMLAPNSSGFDLYFPNSWNARSNPNFPEGGFNAGPALQVSGTVPLTVGSNDILIADFDEANYPAGWVTTGTAFGTGPIQSGTWPGESPAVQGFIGPSCVNTYRGANGPQGTLTSPPFTIQKNYIDVLAGGGSDTNNDAVLLLIGTNVIDAAAGQQSGTLNWAAWNVSAYVGQTAQIEIVDTTSASWGFVLCSWIVETDDGSNPASRYTGTFSPSQSVVTGWSDWGFQFALPDTQGRSIGLTLARGVPFVWTFWTNTDPVINFGGVPLYDTNGNQINLNGQTNFTATCFSFDDLGRTFGIFAPSNTTFQISGANVIAELNSTNNFLVFGALPSDSRLNEFAGYAYACVTNTFYNWNYDSTNGRVDTSWTLMTSPLQNGETNTLQGWLPHHYRTTSNDLFFKSYDYLTPRGIMQIAAGTQFQIDYNFRGIAPVLPPPHINNLPNDYVASRMTNYLLNFAAIHPQDIADTYYGGKDMAITAQYINFAQQLGMTNVMAQMESSLRSELTNWYTYSPGKTNFMFARYSNWGALIGVPADFGSEAFNDNHFHYGYFALATALLGMEDTNFLAQYGPMATLVAKEYANWDRSDTNFPFFRTFDIWEGHSWAGGFSSGGGENQESSSEAMNSWVGLFMLGNMLGNPSMAAAGAMGYATESAAVNEYWQDMYRTNFPPSYGEGGVGILGSGSISYATYFDGDPAWVYAIQWVPENHWNNYLACDPVWANWQLTNMWNERVIASEYGINGFTLADANNAVSQGGYLGNYILGFQLLFDPNDVAAILDDAYATNADLATDPTYPGVSYYLTHSLRGLGVPDADFYTSLPTSEMYYNPATGVRTAVIYNPAPTNQTVNVYSNGTFVASYSAAPNALLTVTPGYTNYPVLDIQIGAQISWPTVSGNNYAPQSSPNNLNWTNLESALVGDGTTNSLFVLDPGWRDYFRVVETTSPLNSGNSVISNGGFELVSGATPVGWFLSGSQLPALDSQASHAGNDSMALTVTNTASIPNTSTISQTLTNGSVIAGGSYNFTFWAMQISSGISYVQNYQLNWLNSSGGNLGSVGWNSISAGYGAWTQNVATNLTAPANTVKAQIQISVTTGAVLNGYGEVLIDDVALAANTPGQTNFIAATVQPAAQIGWTSEAGKLYDVIGSSNLDVNGWSNLAASVPGNGTTNFVIDLVSSNQAKFYRVMERQ